MMREDSDLAPDARVVARLRELGSSCGLEEQISPSGKRISWLLPLAPGRRGGYPMFSVWPMQRLFTIENIDGWARINDEARELGLRYRAKVEDELIGHAI